jgi:PII-like signaling protein
MKLEGEGKLLRIFIGEADHLGHTPLYEAIVLKAREQGLAGATVMRGLMSYGANSLIHRAKILELSTDLPVIIEIVDKEEALRAFMPLVDEMLTKVNCGGMVTVERADIIRYFHEKK